MTAHKFYQALISAKAHGLTREQVAEALGMSVAQYQYWRRKASASYPRVKLRRKPRKQRPCSTSPSPHDGTCVEFITWA